MNKKRSSGRQLAELFFTQTDDTNVWECRCGKQRRRTNSSWENLVSHIRTAHPGYEELQRSDPGNSQMQIDNFFNTRCSINYFGWFNYIINGLHPFAHVENIVTRDSVKFAPISLSTFMRYLPRLTELVEKKISNLLPQTFAIVFDGWTAGTTHYLGVFASFPQQDGTAYSTRLLGFSPIGDEISLSAEEHIEYLRYVLELFQFTFENVICIIGDNCNTNKSISNKLSIPMIGCASHRYNLAVQDILSEHEELLSKINTLMIKLKSLLLGAKLMKITGLKARTRNQTRWSSTFQMLVRYLDIKDHLHKLNSVEVDILSLSTAEDRRVTELFERLKNLECITKRLQKDDTTMETVRDLFDCVIDDYPETANRLTSTADIVHSPCFESAVVKLQRKLGHTLTHEELDAVRKLEISTSESSIDNQALSYDERALQKKKGTHNIERKYRDTSFLIPTSNICERLFSKAGHVLTDRRMAIQPCNLESQLFLHFNRDLWGVADFNVLTALSSKANDDATTS